MIILEHPSEGFSAHALELFTTQAQRAVRLRGEVNVRITSSSELQKLNRRFRKKNKPTDVLSFPFHIAGLAGDIAISADIAAVNASQLEHSTLTELKILILHGLLHLAGYDHETDEGEMRSRETALRRRLGLPLGLIERTQPVRTKRTAKLLKPVSRVTSRDEKGGRR